MRLHGISIEFKDSEYRGVSTLHCTRALPRLLNLMFQLNLIKGFSVTEL